MSIGWNFPSNNHGMLNGIGEAGIETFKGKPYESLAREICQNSLDARKNDTIPVKVEFVLEYVLTTQIPDFLTLKKSIKSCLDFWSEQNNDKTVKFFKKAVEVSEANKIPVLRISDYNTTGLIGSDKEYNTPWQNLVKASGVSDKGSNCGGSFGIGKSAPFACSYLRTVFYSTIDKDGLKASQGIARLVSFPMSNSNEITTGTGYYGQKERNSAIKTCNSIISNYKRSEVGTDVFVIGFNDKSNWENEVISSILNDFLVAINLGLLIVKIGKTTISKENLGEIVEQYKDQALMAYNYYQALTSPEAIKIETEFKDLGTIELYILIKSDMHRRVMMSRSNGMKVFDQKNFPSVIQFAGLCILKDEKVNAFFREMENPQHNEWEPERHSNPKKAKEYKIALFRYIKDEILDKGRKTTLEKMDAEGVGEYLPDDITPQDGSDKTEAISDTIKNIDISVSELKTGQKGFEYTKSGYSSQVEDGEDYPEDAFGDTGGKDYGDEGPNESEADAGYGGNDGEGAGKNGEGSNVYSASGEAKDDTMISNVRQSYEIHTMAVRLFIVNRLQNRYRLIFTPEKTSSEGYLKIKLSGEQSEIEAVNVSNALRRDNSEHLESTKNTIKLNNIVANHKMAIEFDVDFKEQSSMEVSLYGYKI